MTSERVRLRVRIYLWADRSVQRLVRVVAGVHEAFWLGVLDTEDYAAVTMRGYDNSRMHNGLEHNHSGLFSWERESVDRYFRTGSRILVASSGGGREIIGLHGLGFHADGFECNPGLFKTSQTLLQQGAIDATVTSAEVNEVPAQLRYYGGIIVGWGAYTHIPGRARRIKFLRSLRRLVQAGEPILLSFWTRDGIAAEEKSIYRIAKLLRSLRPGAEEVEFGDHITERGYHHWFEEAEIAGELKASSFRMCHYSLTQYPHAVGIAE
jgi:hypothetical protein